MERMTIRLHCKILIKFSEYSNLPTEGYHRLNTTSMANSMFVVPENPIDRITVYKLLVNVNLKFDGHDLHKESTNSRR